MSGSRVAIGLVTGLLLCAGCSTHKSTTGAPPTGKDGDVNATRIGDADREPGNWMTHGRTYSEQRFSPLSQITDKNAGQLGLAWSYDLDTHRGQESTPIVVDGVMYFTSAWSKVFAVNAATGKLLWSYDPKVPPEWGVNACCDVVNRGVAVWDGKVFVGTLDGRLVALDAATGQVRLGQVTIDRNFRYTITAAPRVVKGKVIIGNGGAEMGVRGIRLCLRRGQRQSRLAFLHGAWGSLKGIRESDSGEGRQDLDWRMVEVRRRGDGLGFRRLRSRT